MASAPEPHPRRHRAALPAFLIVAALAACALPPPDVPLAGLDPSPAFSGTQGSDTRVRLALKDLDATIADLAAELSERRARGGRRDRALDDAFRRSLWQMEVVREPPEPSEPGVVLDALLGTMLGGSRSASGAAAGALTGPAVPPSVPPGTAADAARAVPALEPRVEALTRLARQLDCPGPRCPLEPATLAYIKL